jgi:hypothetical protein
VTVPSTLGQVIIALLLVLPGTVYQVARARFRGPTPDDSSASNRILRALAFSAALDAIYILLFGQILVRIATDASGVITATALQDRIAPVGIWALALLVVIPTILAGAGAGLVYLIPRIRRRWAWVPQLSYDPTPRAWDFAFRGIEPCYLRVQLTDGSWHGGWYGGESFASSYPEPRELFIEKAYKMKPDGEFDGELPGTRGIYVRCDEVRSLEFLAPQP